MLALATLVTACDGYPRDVKGTTDRVTLTHALHVGFVAGDSAFPHDAVVQRFLTRVEKRTGARTIPSNGSAEQLLSALKAGALDIVIGKFSDDTPWRDDVAVLEPLLVAKTSGAEMRPIARNGENRWIMLLEREIRNGGQP